MMNRSKAPTSSAAFGVPPHDYHSSFALMSMVGGLTVISCRLPQQTAEKTLSPMMLTLHIKAQNSCCFQSCGIEAICSHQ